MTDSTLPTSTLNDTTQSATFADISVDNLLRTATTLEFDPLLPLSWIIVSSVLVALVFLLFIVKKKRGTFFRALSFFIFLFILLNPISISETRQAEPSIIVVMVDESDSQNIGNRREQNSDALIALEQKIAEHDMLIMNMYKYRHQDNGIDDTSSARQTGLYNALKQNLSNIDKSKLAAVILISDGQVHDLPYEDQLTADNVDPIKDLGLPENIPVHALITGSEQEIDRQILVEHAPFYGITGQEVALDIKIVQNNLDEQSGSVPVSITINGQPTRTQMVATDRVTRIEVPVEQAGANIYQLLIPTLDNELSIQNNQKVVTINGVRDRLQVLLISGTPNHGGRMWRDILRSDASVDLVHFTILREPGKMDTTPKEEMSLIEFPIRELFETKIDNFDLIILDRYGLTYLLPTRYFENMHRFVEQGGGLLVTVGPEALEDYSIFDTPLGAALPAEHQGTIIEEKFSPALSRLGLRHPVTSTLDSYIPQDLLGQTMSDGRARNVFPLNSAPWFRQIEVQPKPETQTLMVGVDQSPLLVLDRYQDGRVALFTGDQLWLWARGYQNGGPDRILLKRTIHWLMKEPDLDENGLDVTVNGREIIVTKRSLEETPHNVIMSDPQGNQTGLNLVSTDGRPAQSVIRAQENGIYSFSDQERTVFAVVGDLTSPEQIDLLSTTERLKPLVSLTKGYIGRLDNQSIPRLRIFNNARDAMSSQQDQSLLASLDDSWMGVLNRQAYSVRGTKETPLIPAHLGFLILFLTVIFAWIWEGRRKKT